MHELKEYITQAEFCKRLGITKTALFFAIRAGRVIKEIIDGQPRIEFKSNRERFINSSTVAQRYNNIDAKTGNCIPVKQKSKLESRIIKVKNKSHRMDDIPDPDDGDGDFHPQMSRLEAESVKQVYLAKQAKLKFLKDAGVLIEVNTVKREWEEIAVRVQKAMLAIPDRVSEIFSSINDAERIHKDLTTEIRHALSSLQYRVKLKEDEHDHIEKIIEDETEESEE